MTPDAAYNYVKSIRPRVVLASAQWKVPSGFQTQEVLLLLIMLFSHLYIFFLCDFENMSVLSMVYTILQIMSSIYNLCLEQFLLLLLLGN